jgi:hypothetical protein
VPSVPRFSAGIFNPVAPSVSDPANIAKKITAMASQLRDNLAQDGSKNHKVSIMSALE